MTHPEFRQAQLNERQHAIARTLARASLLRDEPAGQEREAREPVVLRLCTVHDDQAIERLAALEGRPGPTGRCLVAEIEGTVVAVLPLSGGAPLADPFRTTAHLVPLLELRAHQLAPAQPRLWGLLGSRGPGRRQGAVTPASGRPD